MSVRDREGSEHITFVFTGSLAQLSKALKPIRQHQAPYKTAVIDDVSELYALQMEKEVKSSPHQLPVRRDWMKVTLRVRRLLRQLKRLPVHLIVTCPEAVGQDAVSESLYRVPELPGKLARQVGRYFDVVGRLTVSATRSGTIKRRLQVQPYQHVTAKDRSGILGTLVEDPTMATLYNKIMKEV